MLEEIEKERKKVSKRIRELIDKDAKVKEIRKAKRVKRNLETCKSCEQLRKEEDLLYYCKELELNLNNLRYCRKWKEEEKNEGESRGY